MAVATLQQMQTWAAHAGFSATTKVPGTQYSQQEVIVAIAQAESGGRTDAINTSDPNGGSFGILQINGFWFSHGFSRSSALDPQQSFNFAFNTVSHHGTNFNDWSTFTSGAYEKFIKSAANSQRGIIHLPANGWWKFGRIDNIGDPDPYGGIPKPDTNIVGLPANYPIATILSGTVTATHGGEDAYGGTVTIKLDTPINSLATHIAFEHLSQVNARKGMHVNPGDIIGHAGSRPLGSQNAALGFALYNGDDYGHGNAWSLMTRKNLLGPLNPVPIVEAAKNGTLTEGASGVGGQSGGSSSGGSSGNSLLDLFTIQTDTPFLQQTAAKLSNVQIGADDSVVIILVLLDHMMDFYNPFLAFRGGNIISDFGDFLLAIGLDWGAFSTRVIIWAIGVYILFKVFNSVINVTGLASGALSIGSQAAVVAGSFA